MIIKRIMAAEPTYYEILGVTPNASEKDIKEAYYKRARDLHPDKARNEDEKKKNEALFADVSKAYNVLKDKTRREEYNHSIGASSASTSAPKGKSGAAAQHKKPVPSKKTEPARSTERTGERSQIAKKSFTKGMQILKSGDVERAVKYFEAAIQNDDSEAVYFYRLAHAMLQSKKSFTKSVDYCKRAVEMDPYNMEYKLLLGEIYERAGGLSKAKELYEEILKWDATHEKALSRLKMLSDKSGTKENKSFFAGLFKKLGGKK